MDSIPLEFLGKFIRIDISSKFMIPNLYHVLKSSPRDQISLVSAVELHRFDADHQNFSEPRILFREHFQNGLIESAVLNKLHRPDEMKEALFAIRKDMVDNLPEKYGWLKEYISRGEEYYHRLHFMYRSDYAEGILYSTLIGMLTDDQFYNLPPILRRTYDEEGVPMNHELNEHIVNEISEEEGESIVTLKNVPIALRFEPCAFDDPFALEHLEVLDKRKQN